MQNNKKTTLLVQKVITFLGLKFQATQYAWARKMYGGIWYQIDASQFHVWGYFWTQEKPTSDLVKTLKTEQH